MTDQRNSGVRRRHRRHHFESPQCPQRAFDQCDACLNGVLDQLAADRTLRAFFTRSGQGLLAGGDLLVFNNQLQTTAEAD